MTDKELDLAAGAGPSFWARWLVIICWVAICLAFATGAFGVAIAFEDSGPKMTGVILFSLLAFLVPTLIAAFELWRVNRWRRLTNEDLVDQKFRKSAIVSGVLLLGFILVVPILAVIQFTTSGQ